MPPTLRFLGAAQGVTGSRYLLDTGRLRVLIDCGLYQEREHRDRNWGPFPVPPESIDAVLLTHAHLDHCGLLPKLVKEGFAGRIYCTAATAEIAQLVLLDSAKLQEEDAAFKRRRHEREGRGQAAPQPPIYTAEEARAMARFFSPVRYEQPLSLGGDVEVTFHDAGHIIGSAMLRIRMGDAGQQRTIVFSGDLGRWGRPILCDPSIIPQADFVVMESTYGDRLHDDPVKTVDAFAEVLNATYRGNGNVLIPSFAVERAQEVLYHLNALLSAGRIPRLQVFLDSPMAVSVARVMDRHRELVDEDMKRLLAGKPSPFAFPGLTMVESVDASKSINSIRSGAVIIAGSGMCTGGRIKHHLLLNISRPECTVVFVGYQAAGTLGRIIVEGAREVRILGQSCPVKARIVQLHGFSSHADQGELLRWLKGFGRSPRRVFVTHGEPEAARTFAELAQRDLGLPTSVPAFGEEARLDAP